eukprot:COSAG06_NODE_19489_length_836_cov_0.796472_1_plen_232_part_00
MVLTAELRVRIILLDVLHHDAKVVPDISCRSPGVGLICSPAQAAAARVWLVATHQVALEMELVNVAQGGECVDPSLVELADRTVLSVDPARIGFQVVDLPRHELSCVLLPVAVRGVVRPTRAPVAALRVQPASVPAACNHDSDSHGRAARALSVSAIGALSVSHAELHAKRIVLIDEAFHAGEGSFVNLQPSRVSMTTRPATVQVHIDVACGAEPSLHAHGASRQRGASCM